MKHKKLTALFLSLAMCASSVPAALAANVAEANAYPEKFDLRDYGVVTPVKIQNPFGTCWAFGGIAAAETSILTTLGLTAEEYQALYGEELDLSEKHLAWFAMHPIHDHVNESQAGEGLLNEGQDTDPLVLYNAGGEPIYITTLFSSGVGPVFEKDFPYQGASGMTERELYENYPDRAKALLRRSVEKELGCTLEEAVAMFQEDPELPKTVFRGTYADGYLDASVPGSQLTVDMLLDALYRRTLDKQQKGTYFTSDDDWAIPELGEDGHPNRNRYAGFTLKDGNQLPEPSVRDDEGKWAGLNETGIRAIKSELMQGRAVTIAFRADQARPEDALNEDAFMNQETWAQYTYQEMDVNHAVCIVGWDDTYSKDNFNPNHKPPMDGAWIVKNSWGSETDYDTLDNGAEIGKQAWGCKDENGKSTGFFYLSYCDKNVTSPESMVFDTDLDNEGGMMVAMYDYMPSNLSAALKVQDTDVIKTANVFTNDSGMDMDLRALSTKTVSQRARVVYSLYLLNDNAQNPEDGEFLGKRTAFYEYAGFHREVLRGDLVLKDGQTLAVVVEESVVGDDGEKLYEYGPNGAFSQKSSEMYGIGYYGIAVVNKGESFLYRDGQWTDWADYDKTPSAEVLDAIAKEGMDMSGEGMFAMDNFSIKLYLTAADTAESQETGGYADVQKSDWFAEDVAFVTEYGIMRGVSDGVFAPEGTVTGEQAMTILARLCGAAADTMDQGAAWAADLEISNGVDRKEPLTREQFAILLSRTARVLGVTTGASGEPTYFADWEKVSNSARNAMSWAVAVGILNGTGENLLAPQGSITRSQIAAMLTRYCQNTVK